MNGNTSTQSMIRPLARIFSNGFNKKWAIEDRNCRDSAIITLSHLISTFTCIAGFTLGLDSAAADIPKYDLTIIPTLGGTSVAHGVNNNGVVVGFSQLSPPTATRAFRYYNGNTTDLGTLGGRDSDATAINSFGQIAGFSNPVLSEPHHGFIYDNGSMLDIGTNGYDRSTAEDINDQGQVAGWSRNSGEPLSAFVWENGNFTTLPAIGGLGRDASARGLNNNGHAVGWSNASSVSGNSAMRPTLWRGGEIINLGRLGPFDSDNLAFDINDQDTIVGYSGNKAFVWTDDEGMMQLESLGNIDDEARAINNNGLIVGDSRFQDNSLAAVIWEGANVYNLNDFVVNLDGWELRTAYDISDNGLIVGLASNQGQISGFLLNPVPEPATVALLAFLTIAIRR